MPEKICPFCALDSERNRVLFESEAILVIFSNPRLMPGHLLVIPRAHVGAIFDLEIAVQREIFDMALHLQKKLMVTYSNFWRQPAGCDVVWHTRPFMPQTELSIPGHAHVHLRPRFYKDPFWQAVLIHETPFFQCLSPEEITEEANRLRDLFKD